MGKLGGLLCTQGEVPPSKRLQGALGPTPKIFECITKLRHHLDDDNPPDLLRASAPRASQQSRPHITIHNVSSLPIRSPQLRPFARTRAVVRPSVAFAQRRHESTEAATSTSPKITTIVDQISQLTLLETADLVASLKSRLNIPDLPVGGFAAAPAAPAAVEEADEPAPAAQEKTLFSIKLTAFEAGSKPKVIKEIKNLLGLSLVDSKKFVESVPKMMKDSVPKDEAEKVMATMKELGATVVME
ncbi:mitochondrial 54S ribosomal bL12m domain-containing protein [Apiospora kogelbergensis]|uniref:mitochondrial 54S ribosomal bL12m domain-containing protein n=1 Tax=Apiospora kogelbergensis TaxID=1337665 RepID=UPI00313020A1